jgi:hypothetical protein
MTTSPIEVREEIDVVSVDPLFIERQRNRYSSRAVAYLVWLNGLAAIALLIGLAHASLPADQVKRFAGYACVWSRFSVRSGKRVLCLYWQDLQTGASPSHWLAPTHTLACNPCRHCWRSLFHRGFKYGPRGSAAEGSPCRSEYGHPSTRALNTKFAKALMIRLLPC